MDGNIKLDIGKKSDNGGNDDNDDKIHNKSITITGDDINFIHTQEIIKESDDDKIDFGKWIKQLTGNDQFDDARDLYDSPYKPMYKHLWIENTIPDCSSLPNKSRKSYQVKLSAWSVNGEKEGEYIKSTKLFENPDNILGFSDDYYKVIYYEELKCFYVKETGSNHIYRCDLNDINFIHTQIYGETTFLRELKSINLMTDGSYRFNYDEIKPNGKPLCLYLFKCFIACSFDKTRTISILNTLC
jgi:hypothetical protein